MIKQTLIFTTPVSLSLKDCQMVISKKEDDTIVTRPIEDIGFVVVDNPMVKMTVPLINALTENNVVTIFCDSHQMPCSMLLTLEGNSTQQESYRFQVEAKKATNKNLWKQIIETKIRNQSMLLSKLGKNGHVLKPYYMNVKSGDTDNREGIASQIYWRTLFGNNFQRSREGFPPPNNLLNYGYAILRAAVARALVGSGLFPAFGIFHRNRYNAFPLADDVMEPYRPFVDEIVYQQYIDGGIEFLDKEAKIQLLKCLTSDVKMNKMVRPLQIALSMTTASLVRVYKGQESKLVMPEMK